MEVKMARIILVAAFFVSLAFLVHGLENAEWAEIAGASLSLLVSGRMIARRL
jgi:hypothetical protein